MHRRQFLLLSSVVPLLLTAGPAVAQGAGLPKRLLEQGPPRRPASAGGTRPLTVVLDPGHGGRDPGAVGARGLFEKDVVLDVARHVAARLPGFGPVAVRMTREKDEFVPLKERVAFARKLDADLFISIHADSAPSRQARGFSAYTLSDAASDALAQALMESENAVDMLHGVPVEGTDPAVADILFDLARRHARNASLAVKAAVVDRLQGRLPLLDNPKRSANFAVLRAPDVPSVLIETGFLSNQEDEKMLADPKQREQIGQILAEVIADVAVRTLAV